MQKTIIAISAVLMASGVAMANDVTGNDGATSSQPFHNSRYGDAAPRSVVVKAPSAPDYSGSAAISSTYSSNGPTPTNQFDR